MSYCSNHLAILLILLCDWPSPFLNTRPSRSFRVICMTPTLHGRYTRDIEDFKLSVPWKISEENEFKTFKIPHFFEQDLSKRRKRFINGGGDNDLDLNEDMVRYFIGFGEDDGFHAELWPNHGLLAPEAVSEYRDANVPIQDKKLKRLDVDNMCHFSGRIRGVPESKVALSTCDGLAGYIAVGGKRYFIEPVQDHVPNADGQHLHVLYQRHSRESYSGRSQCGTSDNWEDAWRKRFSQQYGGSTVDVKEMLRSTTANVTKRGSESIHRYLETLIVCDKKFLDHHKNIDVETYVLTVMNMVADYYHDSSSGNQMDVVVVRIMYLDKEEEEIDLTIGQNAENTLSSFCKWQKRINPADISSPNHHDIAVLLTRYDICSDNVTNCGLMGLAYVATACTDDQPCAINEDGGLVLGIVVAHEMGHVMGCSHDKEGESPCPPQDKDDSFYVMAPFVHLYTTRWSACSKGFMTSLFENDLGECLNDEPQISIYKDREMLPGVVYDANQQCRMLFPDSKLCPIKDDNFCQELLCQTTPTSCMSNQEPPADGTKCGENMVKAFSGGAIPAKTQRWHSEVGRRLFTEFQYDRVTGAAIIVQDYSVCPLNSHQ